MLKTRIIPTLLLRSFGLVKGVQFNSTRQIGTLLPAIKVFNRRDVDELILLDVLAHEPSREIDVMRISDISKECYVPLTVGGGISSVEEVADLLRAGADKVSVNSALYEDPILVTRIASQFGSQCVTVSIDAKRVGPNQWRCYKNSGRNETTEAVLDWAVRLEELGAGEILLTSIDNDGTMSGYDLELIRTVTDRVNIPIIASGGAGVYLDLFKAIVEGGASAVAASSMFLFTEQTPKAARQALRKKGIAVRADF